MAKRGPSKRRSDLLQGTLGLLILRTLAREEMHGWGIAKRIQQTSKDVLTVNQGSLYPALQRLQEDGLIRFRLGETPSGRAVKRYRLTAKGKRQLAEETKSWVTMSTAVNDVLQAI